MTDQYGHAAGNVYGLHTTPLHFDQTMVLDPDYLDLVRHLSDLKGRKHAAIRATAARVMTGILMTETDEPVTAPLSRQVGTYERGAAMSDPWDTSYFRQLPKPGEPGPTNSLPDIPEDIPQDRPARKPDTLNYHDDILKLSRSMKQVVQTKLTGLPGPEFHQQYLDELAAVVLERKDTDDPIRHAPAYLSKLVEQYKDTGEHPLSGRGEKIAELVAQEAKRLAALEEAVKLAERRDICSNISSLQRLISYNPDPDNPDPELQQQLDALQTKLNKLNPATEMGIIH